MSISNEEANIKLTPEQTQAIEETKARLFNLESEISIANKNLKFIKGESEKAIKDRIYQEELLEKVSIQVREEETRLATLIASTLSGSNALSEINQEVAKKKEEFATLVTSMRDKAEYISFKENELITRETSVALREEDLKESEELLNNKHAKIKAFAETI
jgi:hypothetical protein